MNKKISILKLLKSLLIKEKSESEKRIEYLKSKKFLTIEEKRELILLGSNVPLCVSDSKSNDTKYYNVYMKNKKFKL